MAEMAAPELWWLWVTLAVVSTLWYLTHQHRRRRWGSGHRPPGPRPLPLIGNLLDLRDAPGRLHHTLARLARAHGAPVMRLDLGLVPAVVVSSRDAAREAFAAHDRRIAARPVRDSKRALGLCDRSVLSLPSSAPLWRTLRGVMAAHVLSPRSLAARERKVADLLGYIRARAGTVVDVKEAVYGGVANLVSTAMFSIDVVDIGGAESPPSAGHGLQELLEGLMECMGKPNVSDFFPFLRALDLQGCRRRVAVQLGKVLQVLDDITECRLAEASSSTSRSNKGGDKHGDFLDVLLELESTGKITRDNLTLILFDIFAAGSDTMALTVVWAMAELLRNPGVMARLRAEIRDALGGKDAVEEADAAGLPYLQAVVREAMRLHPAAPVLLPHKAVEDGVEIGGYAVPRGCTVIFNSWAIMRDPAAWERPDEFLPERFLGRELDFRGKQLEFVPFGSGRRLCPGVPMAERVVPLVLASLVHAFEWQLPAGMSADQVDVSDKFTNTSVLAFPPIKAVPLPLIIT
jgi:cytochrome P450